MVEKPRFLTNFNEKNPHQVRILFSFIQQGVLRTLFLQI